MAAASWRGGDRRLIWFVAVGGSAALVHWLAVVALVERLDWHPLQANLAGWLSALGVSFAGHHRLTFRGHGVPLRRSGTRFAALSAAGFGINQVAYALLLRWSDRRYDLLLAAVLVAVAVVTWWISRHWVFRDSAGRH